MDWDPAHKDCPYCKPARPRPSVWRDPLWYALLLVLVLAGAAFLSVRGHL